MSRRIPAAAWWLAASSLLAAAVCCAAGPRVRATGERPLPAGLWGGRHIELMVDETGASVELDCATGRVAEPLSIDSEGRFSARGTYSPEHGGPVREGQERPRRPARYRGRLDGDSVVLEIVLEGPREPAETLGPFTLAHGRQGRLFKCL